MIISCVLVALVNRPQAMAETETHDHKHETTIVRLGFRPASTR